MTGIGCSMAHATTALVEVQTCLEPINGLFEEDVSVLVLGPVEIQRELMTAEQRWIIAEKL